MGKGTRWGGQVMTGAAVCALLACFAGCTPGSAEVTPPLVGRHVWGQAPLALYFPSDAEDRQFKAFIIRRQMDDALHSISPIDGFYVRVDEADPAPEFLSLVASEGGPKIFPRSRPRSNGDGSVAVWVKKVVWFSKDEVYAESGWHAGVLAARDLAGWYLWKDGRWIVLEEGGALS